MPTVVSVDTQWAAAVEGSVSRRRCPDSATTGGKSNERGPLVAVQFRKGCDPPMHLRRGGGSGPRQVGAALFSLVIRILRRVERQGGFRGA